MPNRISIAQVELTDGDFAGNLATANEVAAEAGRRGSDLLALPELWLSGYALDQADRLALAPADSRWEAVADLASGHGQAVAGSVLAFEGPSVRNRLVVHGSDGAAMAHYDKVHLFGQMDEDKFLAPGSDLVIADLGWCRVGLAICYDLRFPELFRRMAREGAQVILLAAQWPHVRKEHWRTLVRARAIENQLYVLAANRAGSEGKLRFAGHSMVVDPWGDVLQEAGEAPTLLTVDIDVARVAEVRETFPVWKDVRPEVYAT
jgi:predicted amidohydrolase